MRSLGLDVGSASVKAVLVTSSLLGTRVLDAHEEPVGEGGPTTAVRVCLERLGGGASTVVSLDRSEAAVHLLELPSRTPDTVRKLAPFQLEDRIPFAREALVDGWPVAQVGDQGCRALLTAVRKTDLAARQDMVATVTGTAPGYHVDALATLNVFLTSGAGTEGCEVLVDLGARKTVLTVLVDGRILAGRLLLKGLAGSAEPTAVAEEVAADVRRSLLSCGHQDTDLRRVVLTGGGGLHESVRQCLHERLGAPVDVLRPPLLGSRPTTFCAALGLALTPTGRLPLPLDFDHASRPHPLLEPSTLGLAAVLACLLGLYVTVGLYVERRNLESAAARLDARILALETSVGEGPMGFSPGADPAPVLARVRERLALIERDAPSAARTLAEVTRCLGDEPVTVLSFQIGADRVTVEGQADSFVTADRVKAALGRSTLFTDITYEGVTNVGPVSSRQLRFNLAFRTRRGAAEEGGSGQ